MDSWCGHFLELYCGRLGENTHGLFWDLVFGHKLGLTLAVFCSLRRSLIRRQLGPAVGFFSGNFRISTLAVFRSSTLVIFGISVGTFVLLFAWIFYGFILWQFGGSQFYQFWSVLFSSHKSGSAFNEHVSRWCSRPHSAGIAATNRLKPECEVTAYSKHRTDLVKHEFSHKIWTPRQAMDQPGAHNVC